jgi:hypothetical protein
MHNFFCRCRVLRVAGLIGATVPASVSMLAGPPGLPLGGQSTRPRSLAAQWRRLEPSTGSVSLHDLGDAAIGKPIHFSCSLALPSV